MMKPQEELALVDPRGVVVHRYHGRHESAFGSVAFEKLKASILHSGGNVLPVLLFRDGDEKLELAFGLRRLHAARELGIPVKAIIQEGQSDLDVVRAMAIESRGGEIPWSAYERGTMLSRCLDAGVYASKRAMTADLGWNLGEVHEALSAAVLPPDLIAAFRVPSDIAREWVVPLSMAYRGNPNAVLATARNFAKGVRKGAPRTIYSALKRAGAA